jgi:hypothetical protein
MPGRFFRPHQLQLTTRSKGGGTAGAPKVSSLPPSAPPIYDAGTSVAFSRFLGTRLPAPNTSL